MSSVKVGELKLRSVASMLNGFLVHSCLGDISVACDCSVILAEYIQWDQAPILTHVSLSLIEDVITTTGAIFSKMLIGTINTAMSHRKRLFVDTWELGTLLSLGLQNKILKCNSQYHFEPMHNILHYGY